MIDISKQVSYWKEGAVEDWEAAGKMLSGRCVRHALFFVHLSIEKLLKAHVCRHTGDLAPRTHNLVRLAGLSGLRLNKRQVDVLAEINSFNLEGRYPETLAPPPSLSEARKYRARAKEVYTWLLHRLLRP